MHTAGSHWDVAWFKVLKAFMPCRDASSSHAAVALQDHAFLLQLSCPCNSQFCKVFLPTDAPLWSSSWFTFAAHWKSGINRLSSTIVGGLGQYASLTIGQQQIAENIQAALTLLLSLFSLPPVSFYHFLSLSPLMQSYAHFSISFMLPLPSSFSHLRHSHIFPLFSSCLVPCCSYFPFFHIAVSPSLPSLLLCLPSHHLAFSFYFLSLSPPPPVCPELEQKVGWSLNCCSPAWHQSEMTSPAQGAAAVLLHIPSVWAHQERCHNQEAGSHWRSREPQRSLWS